jgi:hypothetical protein
VNRGWKLKLARKPVKKRFDALVEIGNYTHLASLVDRIIKGKNLGLALKEIRARLKDKDKEVVKEAEELYEAVGGYAEELIKAAAECKETDPVKAIAQYKEIAELFTGDIVADQARKEIKALERHPKVKNEQRAQYIWKQILAYSMKLKPYQGSLDPRSQGFRRLNRNSIRVLMNECHKLLKKYPDTSVIPAVKAFIDSYTK